MRMLERNKVTAAYQRGDRFAKRRKLMEAWSALLRRHVVGRRQSAADQGTAIRDVTAPFGTYQIDKFLDRFTKALRLETAQPTVPDDAIPLPSDTTWQGFKARAFSHPARQDRAACVRRLCR